MNTSLHGLKYIAESERSLMERIWWSMMVICSFGLCVYLVAQVWDRWTNSPIIVSMDENSTPIWKIPFPAITICPTNGINTTKFSFQELCETLDFDYWGERTFFDFYNTLCDNTCLRRTSESFIEGEYLLKWLSKINLPVELNWLFKTYTDWSFCTEKFARIMTDKGWCLTYNNLHHDDVYTKQAVYDKHHDKESFESHRISDGWNFDTGYPETAPFHTYPVRAKPSTRPAMDIALHSYLDREYIDINCTNRYQGIWVAIHPQHVMPRQKDFMQAPFGKLVRFDVKSSVMYTSDALKNYDPKKRKCYFSYERKLRFYKNYTREYCEYECITNHTMLTCGCALLGMPRDPIMPICSSGSLECTLSFMLLSVMESGYEFLPEGILEPPKEFFDRASDESRNITRNKNRIVLEALTKCNCMPSCTTITYETTLQVQEASMAEYLRTVYNFELEKGLIVTPITIYMTQQSFLMSIRSELYSITDFLANCGGLIGVCLGFSILSLVEFVYFFIIRVVCDMKKKRYHKEKPLHRVIAVRPRVYNSYDLEKY